MIKMKNNAEGTVQNSVPTISKLDEDENISCSTIIRINSSASTKKLCEDTKLVAKRKESSRGGNLVKARLMKLNNDAPPIAVSVVSVTKQKLEAVLLDDNKSIKEDKLIKSHEPKKTKLLNVTTQKKVTTTTATTTSIKRKTESMEKRVQHISSGMSVEEVERKTSRQDDIKVSKVTIKKEESPELSNSTTFVRKNILKQGSLKSTTQRDRKEEQKGDKANIVKTSKFVLDKNVDKITVEEHAKSNGKSSKLSIAGENDATQKVESQLELEITPQKTHLRKGDMLVTEKMKSRLKVGMDGKKSGLDITKTTKVKLTSTVDKNEDKVPTKQKPTPEKIVSKITTAKCSSDSPSDINDDRSRKVESHIVHSYLSKHCIA
uniref:CaM_binding domain-containing protein n=1 Tax=Heterorhabditis bacteriophora TaxID=37862 RepID=A0A1I7XN61_HETBA